MDEVEHRYMTREEYLRQERVAEAKHEYIAGEMVAMSGVSRRHSLIAGQLFILLSSRLNSRACEVHFSELRVRVDADGTYTYPDISVTCDEPRFEDNELDTLLNPTVLIEVLSKSTANWDRGGKFESYRKLPSLREYVLVSQDPPQVELRSRQSESTWLMTVVEGLDGVLRLESIGCEIPLADIYERVTFDAPPEKPK